MALACRTGIPVAAWLAEPEAVLETAIHLFTKEQE